MSLSQTSNSRHGVAAEWRQGRLRLGSGVVAGKLEKGKASGRARSGARGHSPAWL